MSEKKQPTATVEPVYDYSSSSNSSHSETTDPQWQPGFVKRLPFIGLIALCTILTCAAAAVAVLLLSNGKTEQAWEHHAVIKPSVLLSAFNSIANLALGLAVAEAIAIAWWRKALGGATVQQLHTSWSFSDSVKSVLLAGRSFNFIALAALATKIAIADGILLQRATSTYSGVQPSNEQQSVNITGAILDTIPTGYTGYFADNTARIGSLTEEFASILRLWSTSPGNLNDADFSSAAGQVGDGGLLSINCVGTCTTQVLGAGFSVSCNGTEQDVDYGVLGNASIATKIYSPAYPVFSTNFTFVMASEEKNYTHILMNVLYMNSTGTDSYASCPGTLKQRTCELRPATVYYPVVVTGSYSTQENYDNSFSAAAQADVVTNPGVVMVADETDMLTQWNAAGSPDWDDSQNQLTNFEVIDVLQAQEPLPDTDVASTYGGIALALSNLFTTTANISLSDRTGWTLSQEGSTGQIWIPPQTANDGASFCNYTISDPTAYIIRQLNKIMMTTSIYAASQTALTEAGDLWNLPFKNQTKHAAIQAKTVIFYNTNRPYMWAALASMLICIFCVAPAYYGYWQLGRKVTLGPVEIANAFRAPILDHPVASNGELPVLLREVGDRKVQYGVMSVAPAGRLAIAETDHVEPPAPATFSPPPGAL